MPWEDLFASGVAPRQVFTSLMSPFKLSLVTMLTWIVVNVSTFATVATVFFTNLILWGLYNALSYMALGLRYV